VLEIYAENQTCFQFLAVKAPPIRFLIAEPVQDIHFIIRLEINDPEKN
jgi:hypothetical protein